MRDVFDKYLLGLRRTPLDEHTEHTGRAALETLLNAFAARAGKDIRVQHEPKRVPGKGAPDFKITNSAGILGYVENKSIGENLDQILKSEQIAKYKSLSGNILLTDYLHWIWIRNGSLQRETLCYAIDLENPKFQVQEPKAAAVAALIEGFLSTAPEGIGRAQQLALALATRSQLLRDFLGEELVRQEREHRKERLYGLFEIFRDQVFHELSLKEFADAFAQMLAYGLFLARLNSDAQVVTLHNARQYVPGSFHLIHELVDFLSELEKDEYRDIRWVVEEVLSIVNGLDLAAIHEDLSFRSRKAISRKVRAKDEEEWRLFSRDPYIYFYEDYLAKYDAQMRKSRGVYYTPPPVVNFIVRAIDDVLKSTFAIKDGLADHNRVTVLDFACGTGTFLVEVFERIFENIGGPDSGKASLIVRDHILKNIYGFEYLIAPYTIAHLKMSQYLADRGHKLTKDERLKVFLTNTLEPIEPQQNLLLPALTQEIESAQQVKDQPILVIMGNPPYSGHSRNMGRVARASIDQYKVVDGEPLGERNTKWLQDDYVKFIRFAQMKMNAVAEGVVGIITNHSYLDNPTFRGMRQSLMKTFDQIYVLDLHGNARKRERAPDGRDDQNVFDIEQGVAIALFVKKRGAEKGVWHSEIWNKRLEKYKTLASTEKNGVDWKILTPVSPYYLFIPQDRNLWEKYEKGWAVPDMFVVGGTGVITKRDRLAIHFDEELAWTTVKHFSDAKPEAAYRQFKLPKDVRDWTVEWAQKDLNKSGPKRSNITPITYRPFDRRFTYYTGKARGFLGWPVERVMRHMLRDNVGLLSTRITKDEATFFCSEHMTAHKAASAYDISYLFPLYIYRPREGEKPVKTDLFDKEDPFDNKERIENFAPSFRDWLDEHYDHHFTPEEIMGCIYAILHAPTFRDRYREFLRIDFPRIPFPEAGGDFEALSALGWDLVQKHLLKDVPALGLGRYEGKGDNEVEKPRYVEAEQAVYINKAQRFAPVPQEIWDFHIGGYQVLSKYLKDRKGRTLTLDEIGNVENVAKVLAYTITAMRKIDDAYNRAFGD